MELRRGGYWNESGGRDGCGRFMMPASFK